MTSLGHGSRYRVGETLGEGGSGTVFRAFDRLEGRDVALKVFLPDPAAGESGIRASCQLAQAEFRLLASHRHPNFVRALDFGTTADGRPFFTMEFLQGRDLLTSVREGAARRGGVEPGAMASDPDFEDVLRQILDALDALHRRGVLFLDLKPANILVVPAAPPGGRAVVKLIDFGLARAQDAGARELGGTAEYLAPERIRGEPADERCDLYSLGIILHEVLTGACPFTAATSGEVLRAHLESPLPHPELLPERYRAIVLRLLEKDPARRPRSAWQVRLELFGEPRSAAEAWPPFEVAFVGRDHLLRTIEGAWRAALSGSSRSFLLRGERGSGKTRLLGELKLRLQLEGGCVHLEGGEGVARVPGGLLARLVRRASLGGLDSAPLEGPSQDLASDIEDLIADASTVEPTVLEGRRESILQGFTRRILEIAATRPMALLVDDLEEADGLSRAGILALLRAVEHRGGGGLLAVVSCGDGDEAGLHAIEEIERSARGFTTFGVLRPGGLERPEVEAYLRQVLGAEAVPPDLADELVAQTGGNVFFIEEFLQLLVGSGGIRREGSSWRLVPGARAMPRTVEEAVATRLGSVRRAPREILDWAAIIDRPFEREELLEVLRRGAAGGEGDPLAEAEASLLDPSSVERWLADLFLEHFLRREGVRHFLASAVLRDVLVEALGEDERRRRHGVVARWLLETRREGERVEELSHHLYLSETPGRAREYLVRAGQRARRTGALREAELYLSRALELTLGPVERFPLLVSRQEVLGLLGRKGDRERDVGELRGIAEARGDPLWVREAALVEALCLESLGRKREALERLQGALDRLSGSADDRAKLLSRAAMLHLLLSEFDEGFRLLGEAAEHARGAQDRRLEAECAQLLGLGHYQQSRYDRALEEMGRALLLFREEGESHRAGALESNIGLIHLDRGNLEAAEERFRESLKVFHRIGLRRGEAVNLLNLGLVYTEMGRYEQALDSIGESLALRRELGDRRAEGADLGNLGAVWVRLGCFERAVPVLEEAMRLARELENRQSECANECRLADVDLARDRPDAAITRLEHALVLARGIPVQEIAARCGLARAHLSLGDAERAAAEASAALAMAQKAEMRGRALPCLSLLASAQVAKGEIADAERTSREAVGLLERQPGWLADSHEVWFRHHQVLEAARKHARPRGAAAPAAPNEAECETALRRAYQLLREKSDALQDQELHRAFLDNVPLHREVCRLHEILQTRTRRDASARERSFHEIAKSIHSIVEIDPLLDRLLALAIETTHAEKGLIALKNPDGSFTTRAARGMARESVNDAAEICRSVIADVARGGGPVLATDAGSDDRFRERRSIISFHIHTLMCVPMVVRDEIVGAAYVDGRGATSFEAPDLDYLVSFAQLAAIAIDNVRLFEKLRTENLYLRREVETGRRFEQLIGTSAAMDRLTRMIEKVAATSASVLISGETGTGKELVARAIHGASDRRAKPIVAVDCGALPENLLQSELFGHRRGAFSGAIHDRVGLFEEADEGTIFLDEITNMSFDLQAKLLRVLQEGEIRRLGENVVRKVDVRVIAASNIDVRAAVEGGKFREDLFYRLNVVGLEIPPLRDRREDIPLLALHFLKKSCSRARKQVAGFTEDAMALLVSAPWRGNVRELENLLERAVVLAEKDRIDAPFLESLLPPSARAPMSPAAGRLAGTGGPQGGALLPPTFPAGSTEPGVAGSAPTEPPTLEEFDCAWLAAEKAYLQRLVDAAGGNLAEAVRRSGVRNRNTLISRLKRHGIERKRSG